MSDGRVHVRVGPFPAWFDDHRATLLGPGPWAPDGEDPSWSYAALGRRDAADVQARLRNQGLDAVPLEVQVRPRVKRPLVRQARTDDARRRRDTTPGFTHPRARLDEEGRWSLTPEVLADALGVEVTAAVGPTATVLDVTAGAGGNALGFARAGLRVVAVEREAGRAALCRHNARVYGVDDRVDVRVGDAVDAAATLAADVLFVDPPWGPVDKQGSTLDDLPLLAAVLEHGHRFPHVVVKAPPAFRASDLPTFDPSPVFGRAAGDARRIKHLRLWRGPAA